MPGGGVSLFSGILPCFMISATHEWRMLALLMGCCRWQNKSVSRCRWEFSCGWMPWSMMIEKALMAPKGGCPPGWWMVQAKWALRIEVFLYVRREKINRFTTAKCLASTPVPRFRWILKPILLPHHPGVGRCSRSDRNVLFGLAVRGPPSTPPGSGRSSEPWLLTAASPLLGATIPQLRPPLRPADPTPRKAQAPPPTHLQPGSRLGSDTTGELDCCGQSA